MQYNEAKMSKKINEHNKIKTAKMTTKPFCQQQYVIFEYGIQMYYERYKSEMSVYCVGTPRNKHTNIHEIIDSDRTENISWESLNS